MTSEENVINYYVLCNKLKDVIRTGWTTWHIKRSRVESVAEHIYGTQMLAIAMYSEYKYDLDILKVIYMLAIHELGEIIIGDLTLFQITREEKQKIEREAVHKILSCLADKEIIEKLFLEFDKKETKEAIFAYQCDKLECDIQCKLYDEEKTVDINSKENNEIKNDVIVKDKVNMGESWSETWMKNGQKRYHYDDNFQNVSNYAINNLILKRVK